MDVGLLEHRDQSVSKDQQDDLDPPDPKVRPVNKVLSVNLDQLAQGVQGEKMAAQDLKENQVLPVCRERLD